MLSLCPPNPLYASPFSEDRNNGAPSRLISAVSRLSPESLGAVFPGGGEDPFNRRNSHRHFQSPKLLWVKLMVVLFLREVKRLSESATLSNKLIE